MANDKRVDLTTGIGTISFPHVFKETASKNDKGETVYDIQIIIPKSQKEDIRNILRAIRDVGQAKWGDNWKKVNTPLRDGDKEAGEMTEDGTLKSEKYPERLNCYFLNARSKKPVGVYARDLSPITDENDLYGGCKGKISVTFYPYATSGNLGVAAGLNGVQKIADGESFGAGNKPVESMFDMLDDDDLDDVDLDDDDLGDEPDEEPAKPAAKKAAAKKAPAKKAAAKKKPEPEPEPEEDDDDLDLDEDEDDLYDDLDED